MRRTPTQTRRDGFTLVELLVVITILAILFALSAGAVIKVIGKGDEVRVRNEISQLSAAIQAFKTHFQVPYVPDTIILKNNLNNYSTAIPAEMESLAFLKSVWGTRLGASTGNLIAWDGLTQADGRTPQNPKAVYTLQGHQALVFWLGGVRPNNDTGCIGFSASATNPMEVASTSSRIGPFYDFPPTRLKRPNNDNNLPPYFVDVYETQPYLYFSSRKGGNDYASTIGSITPYMTAANRFANPNGFQIISAGKDGKFGPGGLNWPGASGGATLDGADDMANFYPTLLGISQ